jgi:hypothetical protein
VLAGCGRPAVKVDPGEPAPTGPSYSLNIKSRAAEGKSVRFISTQEIVSSRRVVDERGKVILREEDKQIKDDEYVEKVEQEGEGGLPARFRRKYEKSTVASNDMPPKENPQQGRTIEFVKEEAGYRVSSDGEPPLMDDVLDKLAARAAKADAERLFLPAASVKVNESWQVDLDAFADTLDVASTLDRANSGIKAKLVKVEDRGGRLFGTIQVVADLQLQKIPGRDFSTPARFQSTMTLAAPIDGSSTEGTLTTTGSLQGKSATGNKLTLDITVKTSGKVTRSAEE